MKPKIFYQYFYEINNFTNFFKENGYKLYNKKKNFADKKLYLKNIENFFLNIDRYNLIFKKD